jgi:hypothetical protein
MEAICKNCQHFEAKSLGDGIHLWGLCVKPEDSEIKADPRKRAGAFCWGDAICANFKPIEESSDLQSQRDEI